MDNGTLLLNDISYSGDGGTLVMNGKIYSGIVVKSGEGGTDVSDTTATAEDVAAGKRFHIANGNLVTGTNTNNADTSEDTVVEADVKQGITFHKADGTNAVGTNTDVDVSDTTATQFTVLNGYKFHDKDGNLVTGVIPSNQVRIISSPTAPALSLNDKYSVVNIEAGYYGLSNKIGLSHEDRLNLIADNIKKDVTILGITGTLEDGVKVAQGTLTPSSTTDTKVNLDFKPSIVYIMTNMGASTYFGSGIFKADGTSTGSRYGTGSSPVASPPCSVTLQNDGFLIKSATNRYETLTYYVAIG